MSYILDALKKSQADQQGEAVTVAMTPQNKRDNAKWIWILATALVINMGILGWFIFDSNSEPTETIATTLEQTSLANTTVENPESRPGTVQHLNSPLEQQPVQSTPPASSLASEPRPAIVETAPPAQTTQPAQTAPERRPSPLANRKR